MAYEPTEWADGEDGGTPITAAELNRMEQGIVDAQNVAVSFSDVSGTASASQIPTLAQSKITGLTAALAGKADSSDIPDVSGFATKSELSAGLDGKASAQDLADLAARVAALEPEEA